MVIASLPIALVFLPLCFVSPAVEAALPAKNT